MDNRSIEGIFEFAEEEDSDTAAEPKRLPSAVLSQSTSSSCSSGVRTRSIARAELVESFASQPSMSERPKKCKPLHSCTFVSFNCNGI